ncbi:MAG: leucyl aminopeptidase [Rhodospirillales bacterium]|nr:leucyl aminopeptidase [Rhodospirillales bacterium]
MKIAFSDSTPAKTGALVVGLTQDGSFTAAGAELDEKTGGMLTRAVEIAAFKGKKFKILEVLAPQGLSNSRVLVIGMGDPASLTEQDLIDTGGAVTAHLLACGEEQASCLIGDAKGAPDAAQRAALGAYGGLLRAYRFDKYKTKEGEDEKPKLKKITLHLSDKAAAKQVFKPLEAIAKGVYRTRDLVSEPANAIYPKSFVAVARKLSQLDLKISVLGRKEMEKLGMGSLLGVAQGSAQEPQLLVLEWRGAADPEAAPVAICGKGVTFDTGGISLKPAANMEDMKWDMGGAGVVIGLMEALARRKAKANVIGFCGLVENMPDGNAQRPGDIVTSASGQTIEIINTDAEGRLVLADVLWYAQKEFKPKLVVDLATLTGAIIVALGKEYAGLFGNDDDLCGQLTAAGESVAEPLWRMPLGEAYDRSIDSDAADMKNTGNRAGGSITAAQFLQRFIDEGRPWAHLDIAGTTWLEKSKHTAAKGASAFGVRLLDRFIADNYED